MRTIVLIVWIALWICADGILHGAHGPSEIPLKGLRWLPILLPLFLVGACAIWPSPIKQLFRLDRAAHIGAVIFTSFFLTGLGTFVVIGVELFRMTKADSMIDYAARVAWGFFALVVTTVLFAPWDRLDADVKK